MEWLEAQRAAPIHSSSPLRTRFPNGGAMLETMAAARLPHLQSLSTGLRLSTAEIQRVWPYRD
jgi:hypothetical protein